MHKFEHGCAFIDKNTTKLEDTQVVYRCDPKMSHLGVVGGVRQKLCLRDSRFHLLLFPLNLLLNHSHLLRQTSVLYITSNLQSYRYKLSILQIMSPDSSFGNKQRDGGTWRRRNTTHVGG